MDKVIEAVAEAHADLATGHGSELGPASVAVAFSSALLIPMVAAGAHGVGGVKLLTDTPDNAAKSQPVQQSTIVLVDTLTGACEAFLDGAAVTRCRTAAASAVATRCLSRRGFRRFGIHRRWCSCQEPSPSLVLGAVDPTGSRLESSPGYRGQLSRTMLRTRV